MIWSNSTVTVILRVGLGACFLFEKSYILVHMTSYKFVQISHFLIILKFSLDIRLTKDTNAPVRARQLNSKQL